MKLIDVIHFYLGCEVANRDGTHMGQLAAVGVDGECIINMLDGFGPRARSAKAIKPFLRPLSSITQEEVAELASVYGLKDFIPVRGDCQGVFIQMEYLKKGSVRQGSKQADYIFWYIYQMNANMFRYLLSKHFDLFNLIESGQALDATNQNQ